MPEENAKARTIRRTADTLSRLRADQLNAVLSTTPNLTFADIKRLRARALNADIQSMPPPVTITIQGDPR